MLFFGRYYSLFFVDDELPVKKGGRSDMYINYNALLLSIFI